MMLTALIAQYGGGASLKGRSNRIHWLTGWGWGMGVRARGMSGRTHKIFSPINEKDGIVIYCDGEHWRMSRGSSFWF